MTAVESSATPAMTADKGDGTAVADLAMTDDCRVGHVSTVVVCKVRHETLEEQPSVRGWLYKHCWGKLTGP